MKKFSEMTHLGEEGYDRMRDRRLEQGTWHLLVATNLGLVGHNPNLCLRKRKVVKTLPDYMKKSIEAKYGKGAIMDVSKKTKKEAVEYTGPKKGDLKGYGSKAFKEYEKNMDPKKRQALKDKATKGMKFTHEEVEQVDEVVKMSRKEYAKIHKDFKSDDPKKPKLQIQ